MANAFTIYWKGDGWQGLKERDPIRCAVGSGFVGRVERGDRVYVTNVLDGQLRLLGAFHVERVVDHAKDGKPHEAIRDGAEYLCAEIETSAPLDLRTVSMDVVTALRFHSAQGGESGVKMNAEGKVDSQTMRTVRQLTRESANKLETLLGSAPTSDWSRDDLKESVITYLEMAHRLRVGLPVVKSGSYRDLAVKIGRSEKSCEYRMQNISYVLQLMGRDWIKGLPPAKNVGANVAVQIEKLIGEVEERDLPPRVGEAIAVTKIRGKPVRRRPEGQKTPRTVSSTATSFVRDPSVKAWVLERANGTCEACNQAAPFIGVDGFPFLEVHHMRTLADGGSDTVTNAVAVCPNCHRRLHFCEDSRAYRQSVYERVEELDFE